MRDDSLVQIAGFRTLAVVAGSMITVVIVGLLTFRSYEELLADHTSALHRTATDITSLLKQQLPLDVPNVMACQHRLALQCDDHYTCLESSRYQWAKTPLIASSCLATTAR